MRARLMSAACLIGFALPACASDDVAAAQSVIRSQAEAFGHDDAAAAYSYAAPAIRGMFPQAMAGKSLTPAPAAAPPGPRARPR
jgi:hypothetical protein